MERKHKFKPTLPKRKLGSTSSAAAPTPTPTEQTQTESILQEQIQTDEESTESYDDEESTESVDDLLVDPLAGLKLGEEIYPEIYPAWSDEEDWKIEDEEEVLPATRLGLTESSEEPKLLLFKFPSSLPIKKENLKGKEKRGYLSKIEVVDLNDLPSGKMGKLQLRENGDVKLNLGSTVLDVTAGMDCMFPQDLAAMKIGEKECLNVSHQIGRRAAIVTIEDDPQE
ncbi:uncharacterized protein LOC130737230 [Lotus japonicus]|uniref:uncharacterized protein LOC130737230 n=1 Tax=Lotus japonicus TaxID=34305 RepID=UPI00258A06AA|nr:uncharacterized protein LOC130737230 [Lotus japonicus]